MNLVEEAYDTYDMVVVGTGFAASFFLEKFLARDQTSKRILVLERGNLRDHLWQVSNQRSTDHASAHYYNAAGSHDFDWVFCVGFGGGSNCWTGNAPRFTPSDFRLKSTYGIGRDWPLSYEELEPYFAEAEATIQMSGPDRTYWPQSKPYPLPAHPVSPADLAMMRADPEHHFQVPTARASKATETRAACCTSGVCKICPIDAKFTILNGLMSPYRHPRVEVMLGAEVRTVDMAGGRAQGVTYRKNGRDARVQADLVVLAANAIFNPFILMKSGFDEPFLGRFLHGQLCFSAELFLDGVEHFGGRSALGCHNFKHYDGDFRKHRASMLIETFNVGPLRSEYGRWRQVMPLLAKVEELPQASSRVVVSAEDPDTPTTVSEGQSDYAMATYDRAEELLAEAFWALPIERIEITPPWGSSTHLNGTTVMGEGPEDSVIDRDLLHHKVRNLVLLGAGALPSGGQVNPTLGLLALALRSAERLAA